MKWQEIIIKWNYTCGTKYNYQSDNYVSETSFMVPPYDAVFACKHFYNHSHSFAVYFISFQNSVFVSNRKYGSIDVLASAIASKDRKQMEKRKKEMNSFEWKWLKAICFAIVRTKNGFVWSLLLCFLFQWIWTFFSYTNCIRNKWTKKEIYKFITTLKPMIQNGNWYQSTVISIKNKTIPFVVAADSFQSRNQHHSNHQHHHRKQNIGNWIKNKFNLQSDLLFAFFSKFFPKIKNLEKWKQMRKETTNRGQRYADASR